MQPTLAKYPNQTMKIICNSFIMLIILMSDFHQSKNDFLNKNKNK